MNICENGGLIQGGNSRMEVQHRTLSHQLFTEKGYPGFHVYKAEKLDSFPTPQRYANGISKGQQKLIMGRNSDKRLQKLQRYCVDCAPANPTPCIWSSEDQVVGIPSPWGQKGSNSSPQSGTVHSQRPGGGAMTSKVGIDQCIIRNAGIFFYL